MLQLKNGKKLGKQIGRWLQNGGQGGISDFLKYATDFTEQAIRDGTYTVGKSGKYGLDPLKQATLYRKGNEYLLVQDDVVMSYVPNADKADGIQELYNLFGVK